MNAPLSPLMRAAFEAAQFVGPLPLGEQIARARDAAQRGEDGAGFELFRLQGFALKRARGVTAWERLPLQQRARLASVAGSHAYVNRAWHEIPAFARERIRSEAWREAQSWLEVFRIGRA